MEQEQFSKIGADGKPWPQTFDATVWAEAFEFYIRAQPDRATMTGWFANAMMTAYDTIRLTAVQPIEEHRKFMLACDQTVQGLNEKQALMYDTLIREEHGEWINAYRGSEGDIDAVVDQIVVLIGYGLSRGWDMEGAWREVLRSNMAKIDPATGKVIRRADGKILKPEGWVPPNLKPFMGSGE